MTYPRFKILHRGRLGDDGYKKTDDALLGLSVGTGEGLRPAQLRQHCRFTAVCFIVFVAFFFHQAM